MTKKDLLAKAIENKLNGLLKKGVSPDDLPEIFTVRVKKEEE